MSSVMGGRTIWGGVVPVDIPMSAGEAVRDWIHRRRLRRVHLVWTPDDAVGADGRAMLACLEASGLAVFPFEHRGGVSTSAVAEIVAAYHFDQCEAMIAMGPVIDVTKVSALMTGQGRPPADLAAEPETIDPKGIASCLAVAGTPMDLARVGGAAVMLDDSGCPMLLRHGGLRPESVLYSAQAPSDVDLAGVAALALDAAAEDPTEFKSVEALIPLLLTGDPAAILSVAGLLERRIGPARTFSVFAEVIGDVTERRSLAAVLTGLLSRYPDCAALCADITGRLGHDPDAARADLATVPLDALALIDRRLLPVDLTPVLAVLEREIPSRGRRGGRAGAARGGAGRGRPTE